jgi:hypothetical protein
MANTRLQLNSCCDMEFCSLTIDVPVG